MNPTWEKILLDSTVGYDPEIRDLVADYMDKYKDRLGQVIGATTVDLDARKMWFVVVSRTWGIWWQTPGSPGSLMQILLWLAVDQSGAARHILRGQ